MKYGKINCLISVKASYFLAKIFKKKQNLEEQPHTGTTCVQKQNLKEGGTKIQGKKALKSHPCCWT